MSDISVRRVVRCPDRDASRYLAAFIAERSVQSGAIGIPLKLPVRVFADRLTRLERQARATLYPLASATDPHPTYSVSLSLKANAHHPHFSGALAVEKAPTDDRFGLVMNGHYTVPYGPLGALVDVTVGRRLAKACARDLLFTIAEYIEYTSAHENAARAGQYRPRALPKTTA